MSGQVRRPRAAEFALSLLSDPLDVGVLEALWREPLSLTDLRRGTRLPSHTTLRNHLRKLARSGILTRYQEPGFPGPVSYELTPSGRDLRGTAEALAGWLAAAPGASVAIGSPEAKAAVKGLIGGWSSNVLRALAVRPLSLTHLDRVINDANYPALERRLDAMRLLGMVTPVPTDGLRVYSVTEWLRKAVVPIVAAADWERRSQTEASGVSRLDMETILLLSAPTLRLPDALDGLCRLEIHYDDRADVSEVVIAVRDGRAESRRPDPNADTRSRLRGPVAAWLDALTTQTPLSLRVEGDRNLSAAVVSAMRISLRSLVV